MANIFSYTQRDYEGARKEGLAKIPIISGGDWTDLNASDPGIILLDYVHALVDMVQYYQDHNALEVFITTAKERKNIFRIAKQLSYKIRSAKGAKLDVEFYLKELHDVTIKIPKYTSVYTKGDINYLTTKDAYINAGEISTKVTCVQGNINYESYQGTGNSKYSNLDLPEDQTHTLARSNIDIDSISVYDNFGNIWNAIDHIVFSEADDKVYQKDLTPEGNIVLTFGDGQRGKLLSEVDVLSIEYISSLAEEGRVGSGTVVNIRDDLFDMNGNLVKVYVNNPEPSTGGSGPQSEEDIVMTAPGVIKSQDRAVTLRDFESLAKNVEGVSNAIAYDINKAPEMCLHHEVKVVIVPEEGYSINESLLDEVYDYLYQRMIPPTNLFVLAPSERVVDLKIVLVRNNNYLEGGVLYDVKELVEEYFKKKSRNVGDYYNPEELKALIAGVTGIRYVDNISPNNEVTSDKLSVIKLGGLDISFKE